MTRHGHSDLEKFKNDIDAIILDEYQAINPIAAKKLDLAKQYCEQFHQGSTVKVKKI